MVVTDANINFNDLLSLLRSLDSQELIRGSHHIFTLEGMYEVIIYWSDEDEAFVAEVPELAGCMADGVTYQEAPANAEVIIHEWLETAREMGRAIPEPKSRLIYA